MSENKEDVKSAESEQKKDDPLASLSDEARKIFEETQEGLLTALQKERDARKDMQSQLDTLKTESQKRLESQLQEQGKFKELAEERAQQLAEAQSMADKAQAYQKVLSEHLEAQIEEIPEDRRGLVPTELPVEKQLKWISSNRALLVKPVPPDVGAGQRGGSSDETVVLSQEQRDAAKKLGVKPEDYAKQLKKQND